MPYRVVEETHLDGLDELKVLFLPRAIVTDEPVEAALGEFVRRGGTLVCESECGAFDSQGLYRYPEDRFLARLCGTREIGRRSLGGAAVTLNLDGKPCQLPVSQWLTPYAIEGNYDVLASHEDGPLAARVSVGAGQVILCGSYLGDAYRERFNAGYERFLLWTVKHAGWKPEIQVLSPQQRDESFVYVKHGESNGRKLVFVFFPAGCGQVRLGFREGFLARPGLRDLIAGRRIGVTETDCGQECIVAASEWRFSVLVEA